MRPLAALVRRVPALLALLTAAGCGSSPSGTHANGAGHRNEVRVAAAADLKFALDEVVTAFRQQHPAIDVKVSYGSSGNFFAQLGNRAPFDVFLSADRDYVRQLIADGLAAERDEFVYAIGHLVVWVPHDSKLDLKKDGVRVLLDPSVQKIAIANPRFAPYGRAAEAALKKLDLYDTIRDKLVLGDNIAQTAQFVESGAADIGVIALSLALAPAMKEKGRFVEVPVDAYPRLEQAGVILSWAQDRTAAEALQGFVKGAEGKAILKRFGFAVPRE